jgi:hypothetical protein
MTCPNPMTADLPEGPIQDDACDRRGCGRPRSEHRDGFMDLRPEVIDHDYDQPPLRPYDHERVPCMITTEWRCHACGADNDVWGTGADEGYMECGSCGRLSWLTFDPVGYEEQPLRTVEGAR